MPTWLLNEGPVLLPCFPDNIGLPYFQHPKRGQVLPASKTKVELLRLMMFYISLVVADIVTQGHNKDEFIGVC